MEKCELINLKLKDVLDKLGIKNGDNTTKITVCSGCTTMYVTRCYLECKAMRDILDKKVIDLDTNCYEFLVK